MKDLIIAATTKYGKNELYNYVESINKCGFVGDKIMVIYETLPETIEYLKQNGWELFKSDLSGHIHMHRLISMYYALHTLNRNYRYLITTDVRDVVFQHNPSKYLENNLKADILVSSENVLYVDEPWGTKNILEGYGQLLFDRYKNNVTCNVGVIAGNYTACMDLLLLNYLVSKSGNTTHFTDQSSFNFIVNSTLLKKAVQIQGNESAWALQVGTLNNQKIISNPAHKIEDYVIIHQYDRNLEMQNHVDTFLGKNKL
jgi:hypothetical protein